jgi:hypothetical protein
VIRRLWNAIKFPPPYQGAILSGRFDGVAYLLGWIATFAHLSLWVVVLVLGLGQPWPIISTSVSVIATLFLLTIVLVIHRRMGNRSKLTRAAVWQWWLGPWDSVGRLVWLPVRLPEAARAALGISPSFVERPPNG